MIRTLIALFALSLLPACNDMLSIHPPADEVADGGAGDDDAGRD